MHDRVAEVLTLSCGGLSGNEIAKRTGVPRTTVHRWLSGRVPAQRAAFMPPPPQPYAYLFGIYLGDGWIERMPRTHRLFITLDSAYPGIIEAVRDAMGLVAPGRQVSVRSRVSNCVEALLDAYSEPFIRGLIHSDGCRSVARQRSKGQLYCYPRYFFSNRSDDIKAIFCRYLDLLGIEWNRPDDMQIQISKRTSVAEMDRFVGPKH